MKLQLSDGTNLILDDSLTDDEAMELWYSAEDQLKSESSGNELTSPDQTTETPVAQTPEQPVAEQGIAGKALDWMMKPEPQKPVDTAISDADLSATDEAFQRAKKFAAELYNSPIETYRESAKDLSLAIGKGLIGAPEFIVGIADMASGGQVGKSLEDNGVNFQEAKDWLTSRQTSEEQAIAKERETEPTFGGTVRQMAMHPLSTLNVAAESLPASYVGGRIGGAVQGIKALGKASGMLGAGAGEFIVGSGQAEEGIRQQTPDRLTTPEQSALALGAGTADAFLAGIGSVAAKKLGISDIDTLRAGARSAEMTIRDMAKQIAGSMGIEGVEELDQSAVEKIIENYALDKPSLFEGVPNAAATGMITGMAMGGGHALTSTIGESAQTITGDELLRQKRAEDAKNMTEDERNAYFAANGGKPQQAPIDTTQATTGQTTPASDQTTSTLQEYENIFTDENLTRKGNAPDTNDPVVDSEAPIVDNQKIDEEISKTTTADDAIKAFTDIVEANSIGSEINMEYANKITGITEPIVEEPVKAKSDKLDATQESLDFIGQAVEQGGVELKGSMLYLPTGEKYSLNKAQRDHYTNLITPIEQAPETPVAEIPTVINLKDITKGDYIGEKNTIDAFNSVEAGDVLISYDGYRIPIKSVEKDENGNVIKLIPYVEAGVNGAETLSHYDFMDIMYPAPIYEPSRKNTSGWGTIEKNTFVDPNPVVNAPVNYEETQNKRNEFSANNPNIFAKYLINNDIKKALGEIENNTISKDDAMGIYNNAKSTGLLTSDTVKELSKVLMPVAETPAVDYETRNADRVARIKEAATPEEAQSIYAEETSDNERHFEGTRKAEIAIKDTLNKLERESANKKEDEAYAAGEWVFHFPTNSLSDANQMAKSMEKIEPKNEYKVVPWQNDGYLVQKRNIEAASKTPTAEAPTDKTAYQNMTLDEYKTSHPKPYRVGNRILKTDITQMSDADVLQQFNHEDLKTLATFIGASTSGTKNDLLNKVRTIQQNRAMLKDKTSDELQGLSVKQLREMAQPLGVNKSYINKPQLIEQILKWREQSITGSQNKVAELNQASDVVKSVQAGNQDVDKLNIKRFAGYLLPHVTAKTHPDLYPKVINAIAESDFTAPFNQTPSKVEALRDASTRATNSDDSKKKADIADALESKYQNINFTTPKAIAPKVETKLESKLLNGEISQNEYATANGLTEEEVVDRSLFKKVSVPSTTYQLLIEDMQSGVEKKLSTLKRPSNGAASVQKVYTEAKSKHERTLDLLDRFSKSFEHPFRNNLYDKLPDYLKTRFLSKFDKITTGEKAKEEFFNARTRAENEDLISYVKSKEAPTAQPVAEQPTVQPVAKKKPAANNLRAITGLEPIEVAIGKLGGINREMANRAGFSNFKGWYFTKTSSEGFDGMALQLADKGYDVDGENDLIAKLRESLDADFGTGKKVYTFQGIDNAIDKMAADKADQDQQEQDELLNTYTDEEVNAILDAKTQAEKDQLMKDFKAEKKRKADQEVDTVVDEMKGTGMTTSGDLFAPKIKEPIAKIPKLERNLTEDEVATINELVFGSDEFLYLPAANKGVLISKFNDYSKENPDKAKAYLTDLYNELYSKDDSDIKFSKSKSEQAVKDTTVLYEGKGGTVYDEEAIQRGNLNPTKTGMADVTNAEIGGMFDKYLLDEAKASFDENGKFIRENKYRFVPKTGKGSIYEFNDLEQAKAFADQYNQPKGESRKRIGKNQNGNIIFENEQGIRSYTDNSIKVKEQIGEARRDEFKTTEELAVKAKPSGNTVFTDDAAEKARAILKSKLGQLNSGLDPELMQAGITLAGYHIEKGARTFAVYANAMIEDLGTAVKPYLKSWYLAVKFDPRASTFDGMDDVTTIDKADIEAITKQPTQETENVPSTNKRVERYISNANAIDERDEQPIYDEADTDARIFGQTSEPVGSRGNIANSDSGDSISTALTGGEQSDNELYTGNEAGGTTVSATGNTDSGRTLDDSLKGMDVRRAGSNPITQLPSKAIKGSTPQPVEIKVADVSNIKTEMPFLDDGQANDIAFAEKRFEDEKGVLFTNGTGTGKTFTGLGIMRRFVDQGKDNIIVVAPSQNILDSWIKAAKKFFKIDITLLKDKTDAGKGVVGTTYANFGDNDSLVDRDWDLIVTDESQYLMQNEQGDVTNALNQLRALTHHNLGFTFWFNRKNRELIAELDKIKAAEYLDKFTVWDFKSETPKFKDVSPYAAEVQIAYQDEVARRKEYRDDKYSEYDKERTKAKVEWDKMDDNTKVVLLSATPFAHESNIDYAEGYLFTYGDQEATGYNSGGAKEKYFMQHLGYRMRYNKLTQPDAKVDRSNMQRQFNETLKRSGAISARTLNVDYDYDRRFILTESAVGQRIDEALQWLADNDARDLAQILNKRFGGLERRFLLEAIKAKEVIPMIRDYLAAGKKVIVFHDYKVGGVKNPFGSQGMDYAEDAVQQQYRQFQEKFPDLTSGKALEGSMVTPIQRFQEEFGDDVMIYNGDSKTRIADVAKFNDDNSGKNLMLLQSASAKEGVSFHDTTGKHQRVLINIGLPTAPTTAIQQEGRIFRVGQKSDAIFRYVNTGTNWERWAFASTIAGRASAAENLALGEFARGLRDAFIDAFELSGSYPVGHEGEGKGGKEKDRSAAKAVTEMDKARSYYYAQQQKNARTKSAEGTDYFATPEPVGLVMTRLVDAKEGEKMLEPSAGHGAIARWFRPDAERTAIEPSSELNSRLALVFQDGDIKRQKFEELNIINKYDAIVMNPPFNEEGSKGGKLAIDHLIKAFGHLREGGRVVAIIPEGQAIKRLEQFLYATDGKGKMLNPDAHLIMNINLPDVTFKRAGTGVRTRIVVIEKSSTNNVPQSRNLDLSDIDNIEDLFTRMDAIEVMPRMTTNEQPFGADVETTLNEQGKKGKAPKVTRDTSVTDPDAVIDYITKRGKAIKIKLRSDLTHDQAREIDKYTWPFTNPANGEKGFAIHEQYWKDLPPVLGKEKSLEDISIEPKKSNLESLSNLPPRYESNVPEQVKINARQKLIRLETQLEAGKITDAGYRLGVQKVIDGLEMQRSARDVRQIEAGRRRGANWIIAKLRKGVADGTIPKEEADLTQWLLENNPQFANELGIGTSGKIEGRAAGTYNPVSKVITLFTNKNLSGTVAAHEILHHTETMMPESVQDGVIKAWKKELDRTLKNTKDANVVRAINNMLRASTGDPEANKQMEKDFSNNVLNYDEHYQLLSPSEFWAVNGSRILQKQFEAKDSWISRAGQWLNKFVQKAKSVLGLKSDNAVLKALSEIAKGNGDIVNVPMVFENVGKGGLLADIERNPDGSFNIPAESSFQFLRKWVQDDLLRIRVVMDRVREQGGKVDESNDVVLAMEAAGNIAANQLEKLKERYIQPLIDRMAKMNVNKDDIGLLLYAKHAPERNAYIQSINPKFRKLGEGGSGMTDEQSAAIIQRYKDTMGDKYAEFEKLTDDWQNIQTIVKNILVASGDISPEQAQSWEDGFDYHVPLKGFEEVDEVTGKAKKSSRGNIGQGFSISGKFDRKMLGRQSRANQIVENIVMNLERAVIRSSKMYVQSTLYKLVEDNPDINLWENEVTPMKPIMGKAKAQYVMYFHGSEIGVRDTLRDARRYVEAETARTGQEKREYEIVKVGGEPQVTLMRKPYDQNEEISYWRNGKQVRIVVNDEAFVQAFNRLGDENIYSMFKVMAAFNRFLRHSYTILNPAFIIANGVMVDPAVALYTNTARQGFKYASTVLAKTPMASLQIAKYMAKGSTSNAEWDNAIRLYYDNGGKSGAAFISSIEQKADELNLAVLKSKMLDTKFYEYPLDKLKLMVVDNKLANFLKYLGEVGETATRLSTFKVAIDNGKSPQEAAKIARNVTINFNRRGVVGRELGAMYLFLNASIQGTENLVDATINGEHKVQAAAMLSTYVTLGYLIALLGGDDGDDDLIPEEEKTRFLSVTLDEKTGLRVDWKLPYGLSFFKDMGTAIARIQLGGDPEKITNKLMSSFFNNFTYVNPMVSGEWNAKDLISGLIPTAGRIPYSIYNNRNQWGKPIYPEDTYKTTVPDSEKEWSTTRGTLFSDFAKWMNKVTGGTKVESGLIDVSPESMKYTLNALTGSVGTQAYKFVNSLYTSSMNAEEMSVGKLPLVSNFVKEDTVDAYRRVYTTQRKEAKDIYDKFKKYEKLDDEAATDKFVTRHQTMLDFYDETKSIIKEVEDLRDKQDDARIEGDKQLLKELENDEKELLIEYNYQYNRR